MNIQIDYLPYAEQVNIQNLSATENVWRALYSFLGDYLPTSVISYSAKSMSFPWRYFLSVKGHIAQFISAHRDEMSVQFTSRAREMISGANAMSYHASISKPKVPSQEIVERLQSIGFTRELTINQRNNLEKISVLPSAATFSVPGAGKTTEALAYFFINCADTDRLLVVAPKNAFGAWDEQLIACMGPTVGEFVRLRGGITVIQTLLLQNPRFMIISYDQLTRVRDSIVSLLSAGNIFMFLDESHRIKGGKQVKRGEVILSMAHLPKRKLVMSGTPMPQSPRDLLPQFAFLYPAKDANETTVIDLIQPIYVRTTKSELGLPKVSYKVSTVKMSELQRKIYETLKSETCRQLNPALTDMSKYELRRIGKCVMKVMEFVSNPALLASDMNYTFDRRIAELLLAEDGPKIDYVCRRAHELASEGKKVLIWSCFVRNVELLALRLSDLGAEYIHGGVDAGDDTEMDTREGKIKRFHDDPNCMVLVANPAACSEGISLHQVCHNAIYLDRSFNAAHYLQSEDRIHRLGLPADAATVVEFVECEDSIDQVVRERLNHKVNTMAMALNDQSLKVEPDDYDYEEDDDLVEDAGINSDDAKAVIEYFFGHSRYYD